MPDIKLFFTEEDKKEIISAIAGVESRTTGTVRVRVEKKAGKNPLAKARAAFVGMGMRNNAQPNGVLLYISVEDRKFVILGDDGIHVKMPDGFWDNIKDAVIARFKQKQFAIGLIGGINLAGEKLAQYFPGGTGEPKENPDAITFEES
jgi:uncharacterized membrane protein